MDTAVDLSGECARARGPDGAALPVLAGAAAAAERLFWRPALSSEAAGPEAAGSARSVPASRLSDGPAMLKGFRS